MNPAYGPATLLAISTTFAPVKGSMAFPWH
jgi:hypothetical protein